MLYRQLAEALARKEIEPNLSDMEREKCICALGFDPATLKPKEETTAKPPPSVIPVIGPDGKKTLATLAIGPNGKQMTSLDGAPLYRQMTPTEIARCLHRIKLVILDSPRCPVEPLAVLVAKSTARRGKLRVPEILHS